MVGCLSILLGALVALLGVGVLAGGNIWLGVAIIGFALCLIVAGDRQRKRKVLRTPEQVTKHIIEHFDEVTEQELGRVEHEVKRARPNSLQAPLLYALRVSRCVPQVKTLKTLASRWTTANCGAGAAGLQIATRARNWRAVHDFLVGLYLRRFNELCSEVVAKAQSAAAKRKTAKARRNVFERAIEKIDAGQVEFAYELPGSREAAAHWMSRLEAMADEADSQR